jgi:hypothetical protein
MDRWSEGGRERRRGAGEGGRQREGLSEELGTG